MAQRNNARIDRFAQMTKQEEIIAKKRQEILEKQRTAQLAKAVAAAQTLAAKMKSDVNSTETTEVISETSADTKKDDTLLPTLVTTDMIPKEKPSTSDKSDSLVKSKKEEIADTPTAKSLNSFTGKTGKISFGLKRLQAPVTEQPPPKVVNSFCNDGSFLENFKKILEKHEPKQSQVISAPESNADSTVSDQPSASQSTEDSVVESNRSIDPNVQGQHQILQAPQQHAISQPTIQQSVSHPIVASMTPAPMQHQHSVPLPPQQLMRSLQPPQQTQLQQLSTLHQPQPAIQQQSPQASLLHPPPSAQPQFLFNHPPQPPPVPPPHPMPGAFFAAAPPPPPPPQLPMALTLGPLYMIPAPEPMQLNTIPAPKEFDLNAIPNPQMNVEAIQMPHGIQQRHHQVLQAQQTHQPQQSQQLQQHDQNQSHQQLQQMQKPLSDHTKPPPPPPQLPPPLQQLQGQLPALLQHPQQFSANHQQQPPPQQQQLSQQTPPPPPPPQQQQVEDQSSPTLNAVFSDNNDHSCSRIQLPTTVEHLIELVGENGDGYEDKIRSHKNELHPALWFLFEKNCEQYHNYRQQLNGHRRRTQHDQQVQQQSQQQCKSPTHPQRQNQLLTRSDNHNPVEVVEEDSSDSGELQEHQQEALYRYHQKQRQLQQQREQSSPQGENQHDAADKYDPESAISGDVDSDDEYMRGMLDRNRDNLKRRIECRNELSEEERQEREAEAELEEQRRQERKKQRKSRWGEKVLASTSAGAPSDTLSNVPTSFANQNKPMLSAITRNDPALLQYARLNYGSTNLSEEDWKKCEEHYKVNLLYQDMMRKRQEIDRLARSGKFKYEYDSDEDVDGGTWEHKLRCAEMEATKLWATALTKQSEGKHHIGDFLPPEELKKFMEQYEAKKSNRQPDLSDYKEYKLKEDNIGFQMLQKLGWKEGQGLGTDGGGIVDPVNKAPQRDGNQGLGVASAATPEDCDNEYDAYRKRMMLAYRFRPNPLNNPRRAYY
ncbi:PREDICTED: SURP and G-patch domain-containing protein 1 [Bactrocera latifrons]|uniref:SURP and G-patch domain-containing protein 1 n=1 Tax=Bactrocera latifrons TaxID=174628 RepID=UPI0008DCB451|nr:PREDICTED: SURP and G-patch domain-containing protein 1 [Bactrocera latifrons]